MGCCQSTPDPDQTDLPATESPPTVDIVDDKQAEVPDEDSLTMEEIRARVKSGWRQCRTVAEFANLTHEPALLADKITMIIDGNLFEGVRGIQSFLRYQEMYNAQTIKFWLKKEGHNDIDWAAVSGPRRIDNMISILPELFLVGGIVSPDLRKEGGKSPEYHRVFKEAFPLPEIRERDNKHVAATSNDYRVVFDHDKVRQYWRQCQNTREFGELIGLEPWAVDLLEGYYKTPETEFTAFIQHHAQDDLKHRQEWLQWNGFVDANWLEFPVRKERLDDLILAHALCKHISMLGVEIEDLDTVYHRELKKALCTCRRFERLPTGATA